MEPDATLRSIERSLQRGLEIGPLTQLDAWVVDNPHRSGDVVVLLNKVIKSERLAESALTALTSLGTMVLALDPGLLGGFLHATIKHKDSRPIAHDLLHTVQTYKEARDWLRACLRVAPDNEAGAGMDLYVILAAAKRRPERRNTLLDAVVDEFGKNQGLLCPLGYGNLLLLACMWMRDTAPDGASTQSADTLGLVHGLMERGVDPMFSCWQECSNQGRDAGRIHFASVFGLVCAAMDQGQRVEHGLNALLTCGVQWDGLDRGDGRAAKLIQSHSAWRKDRLMRQLQGIREPEGCARL